MKVFFNASLSGKRQFEGVYKSITEVLENLGSVLVSAPVSVGSPEKVIQESLEEATGYYQKLVKWIGEAELAVFEVSYPSTGIGHEISLALNRGKPVIVLHQKGKKPFVLESMQDEKLQVVEYSSDNLENLLREAVSYASEQMDTRFNFFISPKIGAYLDWISRTKRIPRAVYLRNLIKTDMEKSRSVSEEK